MINKKARASGMCPYRTCSLAVNCLLARAHTLPLLFLFAVLLAAGAIPFRVSAESYVIESQDGPSMTIEPSSGKTAVETPYILVYQAGQEAEEVSEAESDALAEYSSSIDLTLSITPSTLYYAPLVIPMADYYSYAVNLHTAPYGLTYSGLQANTPYTITYTEDGDYRFSAWDESTGAGYTTYRNALYPTSPGTLMMTGGRIEAIYLSDLEDIVSDLVSGYDGIWSVYVKNLDNNTYMSINDRPMKSASVMKLFIAGAVCEAIAAEELTDPDFLYEEISRMLVYSDNTASNNMLIRLGDGSCEEGIARVNAYINRTGFSIMTREFNGFEDESTFFGGTNRISAKDCAAILEMIYRGDVVSRYRSNYLENLLLNQDTTYKIPAGLPQGTEVANKTGEMSDTENDVAIVYSEGCDYIICVLSNGWESTNEAIDNIREISAAVYQYFNE